MPRRIDIEDEWEDDEEEFESDEGDTEFEAEEDDEEATTPCPYCRRQIHEDSQRCPYCENLLRKVRKLAQLPDEARRSQFAVSITRLTVLKSLCQQPELASRFVTHLAQRTQQKVEEKAKRPG